MPPSQAFGKIDIAVNCTGWGLMAKLLDTTEEQLDQLVGAAVQGPVLLPAGLRRPHGEDPAAAR